MKGRGGAEGGGRRGGGSRGKRSILKSFLLNCS